MANMMDYLDWRGDLTFTASGFNEVDNLLFASRTAGRRSLRGCQ